MGVIVDNNRNLIKRTETSLNGCKMCDDWMWVKEEDYNSVIKTYCRSGKIGISITSSQHNDWYTHALTFMSSQFGSGSSFICFTSFSE